MVGDIVTIKLEQGGKINEYIAIAYYCCGLPDQMGTFLFAFDKCIDLHSMNDLNTSYGGYELSQMHEYLRSYNDKIVLEGDLEFIPFEDGNYFRLLSESELSMLNYCDRRAKITKFDYVSYWLSDKCDHDTFKYVSSRLDEKVDDLFAAVKLGVRPVCKIKLPHYLYEVENNGQPDEIYPNFHRFVDEYLRDILEFNADEVELVSIWNHGAYNKDTYQLTDMITVTKKLETDYDPDDPEDESDEPSDETTKSNSRIYSSDDKLNELEKTLIDDLNKSLSDEDHITKITKIFNQHKGERFSPRTCKYIEKELMDKQGVEVVEWISFTELVVRLPGRAYTTSLHIEMGGDSSESR